jgi:iron complex outermembrane recepter protein
MRPRQTLWGALARAARRPTRFDDDIAVGRIGGVPIVQGSDDFTSEIMTGVEVGYRTQVAHSLSVEATTFLQRYDRLRSQEAPSAGSIPLTIANTLDARSSGLELSAVVQPFTRVRLTGSYSYLSVRITKDDGSRDVSNGVSEGNDPHHLFATRVAVDLPHALEVDAWIRHVSALPNPVVPAYTELNARIGWRARRGVELALVGQDLLHSSHSEFGPALPLRVEFQRSVRAAVTFRSGQ